MGVIVYHTYRMSYRTRDISAWVTAYETFIVYIVYFISEPIMNDKRPNASTYHCGPTIMLASQNYSYDSIYCIRSKVIMEP